MTPFFSGPQDKDFMKQTLHKAHVNPPAELTSSLKHYKQHSLDRLYQGQDFFWALTPVKGDYVFINFTKPIHVSGWGLFFFFFLFIYRLSKTQTWTIVCVHLTEALDQSKRLFHLPRAGRGHVDLFAQIISDIKCQHEGKKRSPHLFVFTPECV